MRLEVLGRTFVAAHLEDTQLIPLPYCSLSARVPRIYLDVRTVEVGGAHKGDVHSHVSVVRRAIEAQVDAEGDRAPCRVLCAAVETYLNVSVSSH